MDAQIFISHKHADRAIAEALAKFIKKTLLNKVRVHVSSSPGFEGPRVGKNLNDELKKSLAQTDVVLLVYTDEQRDWQYCMWECGLAIDPRDEHPTNVVVLQCGTQQAPKPFADTLRVDVRQSDEVVNFVKQLLTDPGFFPSSGEAVSELNASDATVTEYGDELYEALAPVIPAPLEGVGTDLTSSPFLRIELPAAAIEKIEAAGPAERLATVEETLDQDGCIVDNDRAQALFGFQIAATTTIGKVLDEWKHTYPGEPAMWFTSLAQQISLAVLQKYPDGVPWAPYRADGDRSTIPYVGRSRRTADNSMQFDTYFIPVAPAPILVTSRMISMSEAFHKRLDESPAEDLSLTELGDEMEKGGHSRVPILGPNGRIRYIIHGSMIDKFISKEARAGEDVKALRLKHLLDEPDMAQLFAGSFAVIGPNATVSDAQAAMNAIDEAQDVFVTQDGTAESSALGWLTNTMFV